MTTGKVHIANPNETEALCGRTTGTIRQLGTKRLVALTPDKCRACLQARYYTSLYFTDAERTRLLTPAEVEVALSN